MRKADYVLLAITIRERLEMLHAAEKRKAVSIDFASGFCEALLEVATVFADNASVKSDEFLKACGIK